MATELLKTLGSDDLSSSDRRLLVIWQNPNTRFFSRVGRLDHLADGRYAFQYVPEAFNDPDFFALDEYPRQDSIYVSDELPAFFVNRVMSEGRASYEHFLDQLGVKNFSPEIIPMEVLARTGGPRATDTFHIVDAPIQQDGEFTTRFFVSGIRHCEGADEVLGSLSPESRLVLKPDPLNEDNPLAIEIEDVSEIQVGWVPDWLVAEIHSLLEKDMPLTVVAEQINKDAPAHLRLLCRITSP